jgi:hypothetical protein
MRQWMNLMESAKSAAEEYIEAANAMISTEFAEQIDCDLGVPWDSNSPTLVEIEDIAARTPNQGWGSKAMIRLCQLADKMGITLTLGVANETDDYYDTEDSDSPSEDDLINFYEKFSFEQQDSFSDRVTMVRTPDA